MYLCMYVYLSVDVCIYIVITKFWFHPEFVMVGFWVGGWVGGGGREGCIIVVLIFVFKTNKK
jgi:hypothetical protein